MCVYWAKFVQGRVRFQWVLHVLELVVTISGQVVVIRCVGG